MYLVSTDFSRANGIPSILLTTIFVWLLEITLSSLRTESCDGSNIFAMIAALSGLVATVVVVVSLTTIRPFGIFSRAVPALPLSCDREVASAFIIFPGFDGPDIHTKQIEKEVAESDNIHNLVRYICCFDWRIWRSDVFRTSFNSQEVGKRIGQQLANNSSIRCLHAVGISVGAFAANECVKEFKKNSKCNKLFTRLTLLDPFTSRGVVGQGYGDKHFGADADFCDMYLNTDDPVPFTNTPLKNAYAIDVTNCEEREHFRPEKRDSMHSWPVAFFARHWKRDIDPRQGNTLYTDSHSVNPRGKVTVIT